MRSREFATALCVLAAAGCGRADSSSAATASGAAPGTPAATVVQGAAAAREGAAQMAQGLQQIAQGVQQAAVNAARPVAFEQLAAVIGDVDGWSRADPTGEQMSLPVPFSRAEARYQREQRRVTVEIQDTAFSQLLLAPLSVFLVHGFEERSTNGHRKYLEFRGQPGFEEWSRTSNRGELTVIVNKRFVLKGTGTHVESLDTVKQVLGGVDITRLAALK